MSHDDMMCIWCVMTPYDNNINCGFLTELQLALLIIIVIMLPYHNY